MVINIGYTICELTDGTKAYLDTNLGEMNKHKELFGSYTGNKYLLMLTTEKKKSEGERLVKCKEIEQNRHKKSQRV